MDKLNYVSMIAQFRRERNLKINRYEVSVNKKRAVHNLKLGSGKFRLFRMVYEFRSEH